VALTYRRMPQHTGGKGSYGHRHAEQEEIYFVMSGKLQFKLGDDVIECGRGTAVRVAPEVFRSVWNDEPEDAELVIVSTRDDDSARPGLRRRLARQPGSPSVPPSAAPHSVRAEPWNGSGSRRPSTRSRRTPRAPGRA
jgi:uncharacterized cupin superfamily protein